MNDETPNIPSVLQAERGVALLLAIFVIAIATVFVFELGTRARFDQQISRSFSEGIQGDYVLRSGLNLSRVLLEVPKIDGINEDWLGEPWSLIGSAPSLPIAGFLAEPRLLIVDENAKLDLNSIAGRARANPDAARTSSEFWRDSLTELFTGLGFVAENYDPAEYRTVGNTGFEAAQQVATIIDFIDADKTSYSSAGFRGEGVESGFPKSVFFNRKLENLTELLLVPGMTLERLTRIAPFVRVSAGEGSQQVNVNTAPLELLIAMGFPEADAVELVQQRLGFPIKAENLNQIAFGDQQLRSYFKVTSNQFSVYVRVALPNSERWLKANVGVSSGANRKTTVKTIEYY